MTLIRNRATIEERLQCSWVTAALSTCVLCHYVTFFVCMDAGAWRLHCLTFLLESHHRHAAETARHTSKKKRQARFEPNNKKKMQKERLEGKKTRKKRQGKRTRDRFRSSRSLNTPQAAFSPREKPVQLRTIHAPCPLDISDHPSPNRHTNGARRCRLPFWPFSCLR